MNGIREVFSGLAAYRRVPGVLFRYRLWPYQVLPAAISLVLSGLLFLACFAVASAVSKRVDGWVEMEAGWLDQTFTVAVAVLAFLCLLAGFFFVHKRLVLIVLSPFLG
ncbi:MAG: hypothetical protein ACQKBU_01025, partial [Verrucomicrobiales bacterium]